MHIGQQWSCGEFQSRFNHNIPRLELSHYSVDLQKVKRVWPSCKTTKTWLTCRAMRAAMWTTVTLEELLRSTVPVSGCCWQDSDWVCQTKIWPQWKTGRKYDVARKLQEIRFALCNKLWRGQSMHVKDITVHLNFNSLQWFWSKLMLELQRKNESSDLKSIENLWLDLKIAVSRRFPGSLIKLEQFHKKKKRIKFHLLLKMDKDTKEDLQP